MKHSTSLKTEIMPVKEQEPCTFPIMSTMVCIRNVCCWQRPNFLRSWSVRAVHGRGSLETWMAVTTWHACETLVAWIPPVLQVPRGSWNWPTWSILLLVSLYSIVIFNLWSAKNICTCLLCIFIDYICGSLAHTPVPQTAVAPCGHYCGTRWFGLLLEWSCYSQSRGIFLL
jgi:hypothetical protein